MAATGYMHPSFASFFAECSLPADLDQKYPGVVDGDGNGKQGNLDNPVEAVAVPDQYCDARDCEGQRGAQAESSAN